MKKLLIQLTLLIIQKKLPGRGLVINGRRLILNVRRTPLFPRRLTSVNRVRRLRIRLIMLPNL